MSSLNHILNRLTSYLYPLNSSIDNPSFDLTQSNLLETINDLNQELEHTQQKLSEANETVNNLHRALSEKNETVNDLNQKLLGVNETINELNCELEDQKQKLAEVTETINELNCELEDQKQKLLDREGRIESYMTIVEQLCDIIASKDRLLSSQERDLDRMFKLIIDYRTSINKIMV